MPAGCNPIYLWESLLRKVRTRHFTNTTHSLVAIPWVYGSHCYLKEEEARRILEEWLKKLQSHEYMGVIATKSSGWRKEKPRCAVPLQSHEYMGVIATIEKRITPEMELNERSCNPMSIWESLLRFLFNLPANLLSYPRVAIPWVYGSHCYGGGHQVKTKIIFDVAIPWLYGSMPAIAEGNGNRQCQSNIFISLFCWSFLLTLPGYIPAF